MATQVLLAAVFTVTLIDGALVAATNVSATQRSDTRLVDISYDLSVRSTVSLEYRTSPTDPWLPAASVSGDVGTSVAGGTGLEILWDAGEDLASTLFPAVTVRVVAIPEASLEPYSVSGRAISIVEGTEFIITNGTGVTVTAVQYLDNECIPATFNILGHWEIHGIVGPARIVARYDNVNPNATIERMMDPQTSEVTGPTEDLVLNLIFGDDNDVEQCPDLSGAGEVEIVFADLDAVVRHALSIGENDPITVNDAAGITFLNQGLTRGAGIIDLSGAEYLTGLSWIDLTSNLDLTDITPLINLPLRGLSLNFTGVTDLAALNQMTHLENLSLWGFPESNVSALTDLVNLETLDLTLSQVTDLSGLADLPSLEVLRLSGNTTSNPRNVATRTPISDLSGLENAPNLRWLFLNVTSVEDISVLSTLPSLEAVWLTHSLVSDLTPLLDLPNLQSAQLNYMPNVDWANYENGWAIVDTLAAEGVTVNNEIFTGFTTGLQQFIVYNLTGLVEPMAGLDSVLIEVSSLEGQASQVVEPGDVWSFPVRHNATVTPFAMGYGFEPESITISRASPTLIFSATSLIGLSGEVLDPSGNPVAGQQLSITRTDLAIPETITVTTNSAGAYFAEFPFEADLLVESIGSAFAVVPSDGRPQPVVTSGGFVVNFTAFPRPDENLAITRNGGIQLISTLNGSTQVADLVSGFGAAWSPDGNRIAVAQIGSGAFDRLVTVDADGSNLSVRAQQSTINSSADTLAIGPVLAWADNDQIAFVCQYTDGSFVSGPFAYRVNANSGSPSFLIPGPMTNGRIPYTSIFERQGTLSPDGDRFILNVSYDSISGPDGAVLFGTPGNSSTSSAGFGGRDYAWSPDGSEIAYSVFADGAWQLYVVSVDESNAIGTPVYLALGQQPTWSPDGRWIAFKRGDVIRIRPRHAAGDSSAALTTGDYPAWQP